MNHLWRSSKLAQFYCPTLVAHSLSPLTGRNKMTSSQSLEPEGLRSPPPQMFYFMKQWAEKLAWILLPNIEENCTVIKLQLFLYENDLLLSLETHTKSELIGQLCRTVPVFSDAKFATEWKVGIAPILDD